MDPGTLAIAATIGSSVVGGIGAIQQGQAQAAAAGYNSKVAQNNAQIEQQNASFAGAEGEQQAGTEGLKTRAQYGATKANQGASGVSISSPSSRDVLTSEAELGKVNAMNIRSNAARQAYGFQTAATSDLAQAKLDRMQQSYDKTSGYVNAASTVLGGASKAALYMSPNGPFGQQLAKTDPTGNISTPDQYDEVLASDW